MSVFVLVPGACHGGWWYDPLVERLETDGHTARAVTPAGLEDRPRLDRAINLDTHVDQTLAAVEDVAPPPGNGTGAVLVGHSYGGSVITGVADRIPERIAALVYLDAFVPEDGDSCWAMTTQEQREWYVHGAAATGHTVAPLPFFDDRARPHPLPTLLQAARLTGAWRRVPTKVHVEALDWPGESPMAAAAARARRDPGFTTHRWATRHNVMHDGPDRVHDLLAGISRRVCA